MPAKILDESDKIDLIILGRVDKATVVKRSYEMEDELWLPKDIAAHFGVKLNTFHKWRERERMKHVKKGR